MNSVQLTGRLTRDPEVRYTDNGHTIARFTLAVDRQYKSDNGPTADFINCKAFGKTAEFIEKYFWKGKKMELVGSVQTGSYTNQDGAKVYTTDVIAQTVAFAESKGSESGQQNTQGAAGRPNPNQAQSADGWMNIPTELDEELPFS